MRQQIHLSKSTITFHFLKNKIKFGDSGSNATEESVFSASSVAHLCFDCDRIIEDSEVTIKSVQTLVLGMSMTFVKTRYLPSNAIFELKVLESLCF